MKTVKVQNVRVVIGLLCTVVFAVLLYLRPQTLEHLELKLYDARCKMRGVIPPPKDVVIAAIDEKSLERLGRWPWSRDVLALLVDRLSSAEAAVIAFDISFPEQESNDSKFADSIEKAGNVILPIAFDFENKRSAKTNSIPESSALSVVNNPELFRLVPPITANDVISLPQAVLSERASSLAHVSMLPDELDGTLRWEAMFIAFDSSLYPSLGLRSAAAFLGVSPENLIVDATQGIRFNKQFIPTDQWGRALINYYGPGHTFTHVSIADIIDGRVDSTVLGNRIVFIGATALGLYDLRVTPLSAVMPGVEKHAAIAASIIDNRFVRKASFLQDLALLLLSGTVITIILTRSRLVVGFVASLSGCCIIFICGYLLFSRFGLWINILYPLNTVLCAFISTTAWNYAFEERYARKIKAMFSSYVAQTIVNELIKNPDMARLGGEQRVITVLFSDVKGFTSFSEQYSPQEVVALLNEYLGAMTDVILKWEGTLDKFIGDAIMVFWNAPHRKENHAELAIRCALEMGSRLQELQLKWKNEGKPLLSAGIGINTGEAVVGNIGAEGKKMDYTIIGDQVNLGSRVESLTRKYGKDILITGGTLTALEKSIGAGLLTGIAINGMQKVIVKGKEVPVCIYSVETMTDAAAPFSFSDCPDSDALKMTEK